MPEIATKHSRAGVRLSALRRRLAALGMPHLALALLVALDGALLLRPYVGSVRADIVRLWRQGGGAILEGLHVLALPGALFAASLIVMAFGLALRARVAWAITILLLLAGALLMLWRHNQPAGALYYTLALAMLLLAYWRHFDRSSLAASSLFAVLSVSSLLVYATFGALYLGEGFSPGIRNIGTAFYFAVVTMSTVGYGDITPHSPAARLFTVSIIILGITVFATSIGVFIGPVVGGRLQKLLKGRISHVNRLDHFVIVGTTALAMNVFLELRRRGAHLTVIVAPGRDHAYPEGADVVVGDATDPDVLRQVSVGTARAVLSLREDDAENAFVVLAVKEVAPGTRTVTSVNDSKHLQKIKRVQPDIIIAPQLLGSELLARSLFGETIDNEVITRLLFQGT
ncbi:MAG: voltage-gated potassium channel protein [Betaproteobacteria bacterium]|nr:voltage-gated potassium channel protein [Betaproteobacteria bacterium]